MPPAPGLPTEFAEVVLDLVASIPPGRVLTYGDVAARSGTGGARAVGTVLARFGGEVPWWRVVRAGGRLPRGLEERALGCLLAEGTPLLGADGPHEARTAPPARPGSHPAPGVPGWPDPSAVRVDLRRCRWDGPADVGAP
ncbi:MAG TPA: MGMT family protein [Dermatophilaceae bacterium]|nr:MGMT family protein [Dermatophilaceae bacterium]